MIIKVAIALSMSLLAGELSYSAMQSGAKSGAAGIYSTAQAQRGKTVYSTKCAACHGADLSGGDPIPALASADFVAHYSGQPVSVLFDKIQKTMPADSPGSLSAGDTADIVAFVLSSNKYPVGADLPSDSDGLKKVMLPKP